MVMLRVIVMVITRATIVVRRMVIIRYAKGNNKANNGGDNRGNNKGNNRATNHGNNNGN